jgi:PBP1b-binding outer membrane lipoprotein LpoB
MNPLKPLALLAFSTLLLAGCNAHKDDTAAQTETPAPAADMPPPPTDPSSTMPSDEPAPASSDTLPTDEQPPPDATSPTDTDQQPPPPGG